MTKIILPHGAIAFVLFIVAGLWGQSSIARPIQPMWLVPLVLLVLLTVTINRITAGISPRQYLPGFALLAVLGSQVAGTRLPTRPDRRQGLWLLIGSVGTIGIIVVIGLRSRSTWPFPRYFEAILAPMALALALGLILTFAERRRMVELPVLMCLLVLTIYPLRIRVLDIEGENPNLLANARFYAVLAFEDILAELESSRMFVAAQFFLIFSSTTTPTNSEHFSM